MQDMDKAKPGVFPWQFPPGYETRSLDVLNTALNAIPLYRAWRSLDPGPQYSADVRFSAMPALTKKDIREHFPDVLPPGRDIAGGIARGEIELVQTSGTTDDKITNLWNQKWWDASEHASWKLNRFLTKFATGDHREAILVNPKNVGFVSDAVDLPMEKRRLARYLYLNEKTDPLSWSARIMDRMVAELNSYQPPVLEANPSMLARLCRYISRSGKQVYQPGVIVFTYEYPTHFHRRQIARVFDVPMASSYGTTEVGYVFVECEHGRLHQNGDFCRVDFQSFLPEHGGPRLGRILVTPFDNPWNYMVRFNTGDIVKLEENGRCPCGSNSGLVLSSIQGRAVNLTLTCAGRLVTLCELDDRVSKLEGIDEYKLVQTAPKAYEMHIAAAQAGTAGLRRDATQSLLDLYGSDSMISVLFEPAIAPEASGKYLVSRAMFPIEVEAFLDN
jgi:phenylacetate-coenzyme A ligase PaaK-like adenylate-forming protein